MSRRSLSEADLGALLGIVGKLEGLIAVGRLDPQTVETFGVRLASDGVLSREPNERNVRQTCADLAQRIHYVLGAYATPPQSIPVEDVQ